MKKIVLAFLCYFFSKALFACSVVDDAGNHLNVSTPAKRIIVLAPDLTEILFAIGAGKQIVGVMQGSDYPKEAATLPIVASFNYLDREKILALHPDLIVTWKEVGFLSGLSQFSVPVYVSHQEKLLDIPDTMRRLGCLTGEESIAKQSAALFNKQYQLLKSTYASRKKVSVFYQVWPRPLMTISSKSWINEVITLCGGENIFAALNSTAPMVSAESVVAKNPDVIVGEETDNWRQFPEILAVSSHHLFKIDPGLIERAGPRILMGARDLCIQLDKARYATFSG